MCFAAARITKLLYGVVKTAALKTDMICLMNTLEQTEVTCGDFKELNNADSCY